MHWQWQWELQLYYALVAQNGETALHIASHHGNPEMIALLNRDDADPTVASTSGETPLHVAVRHCRFEATKLLLKYVEQRGGKHAVRQLVNQKTKVRQRL